MALAHPWIILVAVGAVLIAVAIGLVVGLRRTRTGEGESALVSRAERLRRLPSFRSAVRRRMVALSGILGLGVIAALLAGVVAARPMASQTIQPVNSSRDIVLCLDVSGSMIDVDREVIDVFDKLLDGFKGERIGLTIFNSSPVQVFPLTDDYAFIRQQLSELRKGFDYQTDTPEHWVGTLNGPGASLIGDGLASCAMRFDHLDDDRSRSVILATDNEVNGAQIVTLDEAAAYSRGKKVKVFALDPVGDPKAETSIGLSKAAQTTGGQSYALRATTTVGDIISEIQKQQATALRGQTQVVWVDSPALWVAVLLVGALGFLVLLWRVRL
ncbi:VWA domain-containing protein [Microbacterium sp.]|uniref:vWA domain-containing protein n=1 Tax=Microbacterium sp. TaxID=51671 RepID=UPI00333FF7B6